MKHLFFFILVIGCTAFLECLASDTTSTFSLKNPQLSKSFEDEILNFWFGKLGKDGSWDPQTASRWFKKNPAFDKKIKERFVSCLQIVAQKNFSTLSNNAKSHLAHIILLDQFPRNIYRNDPRSYDYDPLALELTLKGIETGYDQKLYPIERAFFYLPLEHCENLEIQNLSIKLFKKLLEDAPASQKEYFEQTHDYAIRHQVIIERFGRFPHRNKILGRSSTPEELEFLNQKGSSF